ncbi:MAG: hypothetical protein AAFP83_01065 [Bacteroidota bacterium]
MTLLEIMQLQLAFLQAYLQEMQQMQTKAVSKENAMDLITRIREQREITSALVKKTVNIAKMRDIPTRSMN